MPGELFMAGAVLIPLGFGLVPAFLPRSLPIFIRWCLWLILLAASATFVSAMRGAPELLGWLAFGSFCASMVLSLWVLVMETRRASRSSSANA